MIKTRVREFRKARGWTLAQLATKSGVSESQLSKIENQNRGWSVASLERIALALNVKVGELFEAAGAWQDVPVFGIVGDRGVVKPSDNKDKKALRIKAPAAIGSVLALKIEGDAMYPRYSRDDVVFCQKTSAKSPRECLDRECLVYLDTGEAMLRTVYEGAEPDRYNLSIHTQAPLQNAEIVSCRPVVYVARGAPSG